VSDPGTGLKAQGIAMHKFALNKSPLFGSAACVDAERVGVDSLVLASVDQHEAAPHDQPRRLMSAPQLAEMLNVSLSWVNKAHVYGTGPPARRVGRRRLYDPIDVEKWLTTRRQQNTSEQI
jgi:predicted DNA-binding transcriptional regulator AlpA